MEIIIVGCGKVGYSIARHLSEEENNVVIIDKKLDSFDKIVESIDVMVIKGNGLSGKILIEAGIRSADLIICVTNSDETNILCCLTAKKLGIAHTIARVRDPEYSLELSKLKKDLGLDMIINPELQAALEIGRLLRFPAANNIETFVGGRVELLSLPIPEGNMLVGKNLQEISGRLKMPVLFTLVERGGEITIPRGDFEIMAGDVAKVLGRPTDLSNFIREIGIFREKIKDVMIIGGGKITRYLAENLINHNINVKIVEIDENKCLELSEALPRCVVIRGDGTDEEILKSEDISDSDAVISLTDRDEENVIIALYSKQAGVEKTVVKINHINANLVKNLGIGSIVCPKNITAYQIVRYVRGLKNSYDSSNIETMYKISDLDAESVEALEFNVGHGSDCLNIPLKELPIRKGILIGCIVHGSNVQIATGASIIRDNDSVIVIAKNKSLLEFDDILKSMP